MCEGESYAQAMLVLEQGVSNLQASDGDSGEDAIGLLLLAMSTLLYERLLLSFFSFPARLLLFFGYE